MTRATGRVEPGGRARNRVIYFKQPGRTQDIYDLALRCHLIPAMGSLLLCDIEGDKIKAYQVKHKVLRGTQVLIRTGRARDYNRAHVANSPLGGLGPLVLYQGWRRQAHYPFSTGSGGIVAASLL